MSEEHQILTPDEIQTVLASLHHKAKRSKNARTNLAIFRLSCCCGLRVCEIQGLDVADIILDGPYPRVVVRPEIAKGHKVRSRNVSLKWDRGTYDDLSGLVGGRETGPAITRTNNGVLTGACADATREGDRITRSTLQKRWRTAIKCLGSQRQGEIPIHCGRRSFASHAMAAGRTLIEISKTLGHSNIKTTSVYLFEITSKGLPDVFSQPVTATTQ